MREEVEKLQGRVRELEDENKEWGQKVEQMHKELDESRKMGEKLEELMKEIDQL
jgi:peptidoglycan hydrolase CwlO-like protein